MPLGQQGLRVQSGDGVERQMQQRHVRPPRAHQLPLLVRLAQQQIDRARAGVRGVRVEHLGGWPDEPTSLDPAALLRLVDTNVVGVVRVTNAMLPLLRRSAYPRIVNQSSHVASLTLQTDPGTDLGGISGGYATTKTFLNAVTVRYAAELRSTPILVNNACPGYVATDLNAFSGTRTAEEGARVVIRLATLPDDGPTGGLFDDEGPVPW
ncbi:SDR family NAD(P)-dependent oxidoreductase [Streptomyces globisporus]|uniref:SDR family NAD(P)-dependent oxidoreductase n=2 Tax=Streptomyces globisporus TaxID=1908 RepID=UPI00381829E5